MDFQIYDALPEPAKAICVKVAADLFSKLLGGAWNAGARKTPGAVFAGIYRQWRDDLAEAEADDEKLAATFEEFFSRKPTIQELGKLLRNQYARVDFQVL